MVTLSPAFPSSGVSLSSVGASPKQDGAFPAVSAVANFGAATFGAVVLGAGALVRVRAGFFTFFSCLTGSAAQVPAGLIAARQIASIPIATVILGPVAVYMTGLRFFC
jgi:hypothetical protein